MERKEDREEEGRMERRGRRMERKEQGRMEVEVGWRGGRMERKEEGGWRGRRREDGEEGRRMGRRENRMGGRVVGGGVGRARVRKTHVVQTDLFLLHHKPGCTFQGMIPGRN